jgi:hypothetical protein
MDADGPASAKKTRTFSADYEVSFEKDSTGNPVLQPVAQVIAQAIGGTPN